jgi:hypothetical protein
LGYLLFIFYCILFCWLITRIKSFKETGLSNRLLIFLFLARIIVSLFSCYINIYYYQVSDILIFQQQGVEEFHLLFSNPGEYFTNIFHSGHSNGYSGFLASSDSYWNDTRSNIIIKILSVFNIFSAKNFFVNTLIYNFFIFWGSCSLYKVFTQIFPGNKLILICCIFLLPSVIYFTSGIHRDGLIFLSLSILVYHLFYMLKNRHFSMKRTLVILIFSCLVLLLRNFVFLTLLPALIAWIVAELKPKYAFISFAEIYCITIILFFCSSYLSPQTDLPAYVSSRQIAFIEIAKGGASAININPLYPNFRSFLNNTPQALNHSLMRPYLTEKFTFVFILSALEIFLYEIIFILFIFFRKKNISIKPFIYFCIFFSLSMLLVIGYTIPIIGAIVRYRSTYFPFLLIPIFCQIDWNKIEKAFTLFNNRI